MAENLDEIRNALLAIGKALGVDFAVSPAAGDDPILKPDGDRHYDRIEVTSTQIQQIPPVEIPDDVINPMRSDSRIVFRSGSMHKVENQNAVWPKSLGTKQNVRIENVTNSTPTFTWQLDSKAINPGIKLFEYGYDENGYPCQLSEQCLSTQWTELRHLTENLTVVSKTRLCIASRLSA
jgi:hypothetical protein